MPVRARVTKPPTGKFCLSQRSRVKNVCFRVFLLPQPKCMSIGNWGGIGNSPCSPNLFKVPGNRMTTRAVAWGRRLFAGNEIPCQFARVSHVFFRCPIWPEREKFSFLFSRKSVAKRKKTRNDRQIWENETKGQIIWELMFCDYLSLPSSNRSGFFRKLYFSSLLPLYIFLKIVQWSVCKRNTSPTWDNF